MSNVNSNNNLSDYVSVYKSRNIFLRFGYWITGKGTAYTIKMSDSQFDHNCKLHIGQKDLSDYKVTIADIESLGDKSQSTQALENQSKAVLAAFKRTKINDLVDMISGFRPALIADILYKMLATEEDDAYTVAGNILSNMVYWKTYSILESMFTKTKNDKDNQTEANNFFENIIIKLDADQAVKLLTGIFRFMPGISYYDYNNDINNNNNVFEIVINVLCELLTKDNYEQCNKVKSIIVNMINQSYTNDIGGLCCAAAKAADILEAMQPARAADVLDEIVPDEYMTELGSVSVSEEQEQQLENIATEMLNKFDDAYLVNILVRMSEIQRDNMLVVMNDCDSTRAKTLTGEVYDFINAIKWLNKGAEAAATDCTRMEPSDVANRFVMILQGSDEGTSFVADVMKSLQPDRAVAILNEICKKATNGDVVVTEILAMVGDIDFNTVIKIIGEMAQTDPKVAGKVCDAIHSGFPEVCVEILYGIGIDNAVLALNNMSTDIVYNILSTMKFDDIVSVCSKMDDVAISNVLAKVANDVENGIYVVGDILIELEPEKADGIVQNIIKLDQTLGNNINDDLNQLRAEQQK